MLFRSTRGLAPETDLRHIALQGLAPDGGLYLPKEWPQFSAQEIAALEGKSYQDIAFFVLRPFLCDAMPDDVLREIIRKSYGVFNSPEITLRALGDDFVLELFHGPTLAFKDVALQFVGHVFEYLLQETATRTTIVGATSGDTGSAAIDALAGRKGIDVFILYPDKGPSEIQRKQMTCVDADNVHALAVSGSFDDCQGIVKTLFADPKARDAWNLTTVNSINLLRILAQIVYYFFATIRLKAAPTFVVPTGNFGDIFAGYAAKKCGLPIERLVVASNSNNILTRFFASGKMTPEGVQQTLSPSMDIQISSNFERLLFDLCDQNAAQVRTLMEDLKATGSFTVSRERLEKARATFAAGCATDEETVETIADVYKKFNYILDPHTAVGAKVARDLKPSLKGPVVLLATASPAKFPQTIEKTLGFAPPVPAHTAALIGKPERTTLIPADAQSVVDFIESTKKQ